MSGEPPGDVTTKAPFHEVTEQPFTFDYEDATYSQDMDEVEGKAPVFVWIRGTETGQSVLPVS